MKSERFKAKNCVIYKKVKQEVLVMLCFVMNASNDSVRVKNEDKNMLLIMISLWDSYDFI